MMVASADSRSLWQKSCDGSSSDARSPNISYAQHGSLPTTRTGRASLRPLVRRERSIYGTMGYLLVLVACLWTIPASAVMIEFEDCLSDSTKNDMPLQLQFVPKFVDAVFNTTDASHNLAVTVWGNVTGSFNNAVQLPPASDRDYWNSSRTDLGGKILDIPFPDSENPKITTIFNKVNVLTYEPWSQTAAWCPQLENASCPLGPVFDSNM
jgi:hypothetical protein